MNKSIDPITSLPHHQGSQRILNSHHVARKSSQHRQVRIPITHSQFAELSCTVSDQILTCDAWNSDVIFKALTSSGPAVIDFYATWCGPCKAIAPKVGELSERYPNVRFIQIDVDKMRAVAQQFQVTAMPTFVFLKDGKEVGERVRGADARSLENGIKGLSA